MIVSGLSQALQCFCHTSGQFYFKLVLITTSHKSEVTSSRLEEVHFSFVDCLLFHKGQQDPKKLILNE